MRRAGSAMTPTRMATKVGRNTMQSCRAQLGKIKRSSGPIDTSPVDTRPEHLNTREVPGNNAQNPMSRAEVKWLPPAGCATHTRSRLPDALNVSLGGRKDMCRIYIAFVPCSATGRRFPNTRLKFSKKYSRRLSTSRSLWT